MKFLTNPRYFWLITSIGLTLAVVASFFVITLSKSNANKQETNQAPEQAQSVDPLPSMLQPVQGIIGDEFNAKYVQTLWTHHAISNEMAKLVKDSQDKEIRDLANYILQTNEKSNETLQTWAKSWGITIKQPSQADVDTIIKDIESNQGEERDHQFTLDILEHFSSSITLSKLAITNTNQQELKDFANQLIDSQSAQAEALQKWASTVSFDQDDRQTLAHDKHDSY